MFNPKQTNPSVFGIFDFRSGEDTVVRKKGDKKIRKRAKHGAGWSIGWATNIYIPLLLLLAAKLLIAFFAGNWNDWADNVTPGNPQYDYPDRDDTIPSWANMILSIAGPAVLAPLIMWIAIIVHQRIVTWFFLLMDIHNAWIGILGSWFLTDVITKSLKLALGQPRPHFNTTGGIESFPSGHAALAAMGFVFIAWYFMGKFKSYYNKTDKRPTSWWTIAVVLIFLAVPLIVGATRIRDFAHFPVDVFAGIVIGAVSATIVYRTLFRWPWEKMSWIPLMY